MNNPAKEDKGVGKESYVQNNSSSNKKSIKNKRGSVKEKQRPSTPRPRRLYPFTFPFPFSL